ncbi:hypothetical protein [Mammaliicoccus sciuri]|uniref:hypothetical protein n=1 Tax=Mammaliicoccus sciuri TaxID=1296 RepID=UPI00194FDA48|nr:hypothetical protein [Mammaliicoccus sciuri]
MKKLLVLLFASLLVLGACGQKEESSSKDSANETKKEVKKDEPKKKEADKDKIKKESAKKSEPKTEEQTTEEVATNEQQSTQREANSTEEVVQEPQTQVNTSNISNETQLQSVLNGNFSEEQKIQAYNSAVANGVIPQGTVSEGSAQAAYESSKGIQNGESEKDQLAERYQSWVDAGLMTEDEMQEELAK